MQCPKCGSLAIKDKRDGLCWCSACAITWTEWQQAAIEDLKKQLVAARATISEKNKEIERLSKRDCNATIELIYNDGTDPFARETLKILDVGVADNIYCMESKVLTTTLQENAKLRALIEKIVSHPDRDFTTVLKHEIEKFSISREYAAGIAEGHRRVARMIQDEHFYHGQG